MKEILLVSTACLLVAIYFGANKYFITEVPNENVKYQAEDEIFDENYLDLDPNNFFYGFDEYDEQTDDVQSFHEEVTTVDILHQDSAVSSEDFRVWQKEDEGGYDIKESVQASKDEPFNTNKVDETQGAIEDDIMDDDMNKPKEKAFVTTSSENISDQAEDVTILVSEEETTTSISDSTKTPQHPEITRPINIDSESDEDKQPIIESTGEDISKDDTIIISEEKVPSNIRTPSQPTENLKNQEESLKTPEVPSKKTNTPEDIEDASKKASGTKDSSEDNVDAKLPRTETLKNLPKSQIESSETNKNENEVLEKETDEPANGNARKSNDRPKIEKPDTVDAIKDSDLSSEDDQFKAKGETEAVRKQPPIPSDKDTSDLENEIEKETVIEKPKPMLDSSKRENNENQPIASEVKPESAKRPTGQQSDDLPRPEIDRQKVPAVERSTDPLTDKPNILNNKVGQEESPENIPSSN